MPKTLVKNYNPSEAKKRRFAKLGGWVEYNGYWYGPNSGMEFYSRQDTLPSFNWDLKACFETLEEYCVRNNYFYTLAQTQNRKFICTLQTDYDPVKDGIGKTKEEAIIKAVLAK